MYSRHFALIIGLFVFESVALPTHAAAATKTDRLTDHVRDSLPVSHSQVTNPEVWIEQNLAPGELVSNDHFGNAVAIYGKTALISEEPSNLSGGLPGLVRVYTETDGTWTQTATLTASNGTNGDDFGGAIAFNGSTAFIGAPSAEVTDKNGITLPHGAVYVFSDSGGSWAQTQELTASDGAYDDLFGRSVAFSGNTLMIGATGATINTNNAQGAVYVFTNSSGTWTQQQKLVAGNGAAYDQFGYSIAIDGSNALIASPFTVINGNNGFGTVYAFTNTNGTWSQSTMLKPPNTSSGYYHFGYSVALSGTQALIGQPNATVSEIPGSVYDYTNVGGIWTLTQTLNASDAAAYDYFGTALALYGNQFVTSAPGANLNISGSDYTSQGAAYIFSDESGSWQQVQKLTASDATNFYNMGNSVALSNTAAIIGDEEAASAAGAAYMYGGSDLSLAINAPPSVIYDSNYSSQIIITNSSSTSSAAVSITVPIPPATQLVNFGTTKGSCTENSGSLNCSMGAIGGNGGIQTVNLVLKATSAVNSIVHNTASVVNATPALSASATTQIVTSPVAQDSSITDTENSSTSGQMHASDPDGDALAFMIVNQPSHGSVKITNTSAGTFTYTPASGFTGSDAFSFKATDGQVDSNIATVSIAVTAQNSGGGNGGSGGGGGTGLPALLALAVLAGFARRRR